MDINNFLKLGRMKKGWDFRRASEELENIDIKYSHTSIQRLEKGTIKKIPIDIINGMIIIYNLDQRKTYELAGIKENSTISDIEDAEQLELPVYGIASAGNGALDFEVILENFTLPIGYKIPIGSFIVKVSGDSMEPNFYNGDRIIVDATQCKEWQNLEGYVVIVQINEERFIKVVRFNNFIPEFHSLNKFFPPIEVKKGDVVKCVGVVTKIFDREVGRIK